MRRWLCPPPPKREERVKLREEERLEKCQKEESLKKQEQIHQEQVKKHQHNLEQQKLMPQDVQLRLESVSLEVKALGFGCGDKGAGGTPIHALCLAPRTLLLRMLNQTAPTIYLDMTAIMDSDDDDMEESGAGPWRTVASNQKSGTKFWLSEVEWNASFILKRKLSEQLGRQIVHY